MFGRHWHDGSSDRRVREGCEMLLAAAVAARDVHLDAADDEENGGALRADAVAHVALLHHCVAFEHEVEAAAENCRSDEASYCDTPISINYIVQRAYYCTTHKERLAPNPMSGCA